MLALWGFSGSTNEENNPLSININVHSVGMHQLQAQPIHSLPTWPVQLAQLLPSQKQAGPELLLSAGIVELPAAGVAVAAAVAVVAVAKL